MVGSLASISSKRISRLIKNFKVAASKAYTSMTSFMNKKSTGSSTSIEMPPKKYEAVNPDDSGPASIEMPSEKYEEVKKNYSETASTASTCSMSSDSLSRSSSFSSISTDATETTTRSNDGLQEFKKGDGFKSSIARDVKRNIGSTSIKLESGDMLRPNYNDSSTICDFFKQIKCEEFPTVEQLDSKDLQGKQEMVQTFIEGLEENSPPIKILQMLSQSIQSDFEIDFQMSTMPGLQDANLFTSGENKSSYQLDLSKTGQVEVRAELHQKIQDKELIEYGTVSRDTSVILDLELNEVIDTKVSHHTILNDDELGKRFEPVKKLFNDVGDVKTLEVKKQMDGIKNDLFSQLDVALENASKAAGKLGVDYNVESFRKGKEAEIENAYNECDSPEALGEQLRTQDGKKDDFGFQKILQGKYEVKLRADDSDITLKKASKLAKKGVKEAMKSTKGQVLDEHGMQDKYQDITQDFTLDSGATIKTITTQQADDFVSSATHASNPNHIGNLHLETNEITVKDTEGNDKTVTKKTLRHGAINTHHLKDGIELNGFEKVSGYGAEDSDADAKGMDLEDLANKIRDDLQSSDSVNVERGQNALKKLGISEGKVKAWNRFLNGGTIRTDLLKKKLNQKLALRNKAIDLAKAAYKAAPDGEKGSITINSFSLLTPDTPRDIKAKLLGGHSEKQALKEQVEAYKILEEMTKDERVAVFGEDTKFKVNAFNFGVNEGAEMGFSTQQVHNEKAMTSFKKDIASNIATMAEGPEKDAANQLMENITTSYDSYKSGRLGSTFHGKGNWRADQAYALVAKMQTLADVTSAHDGAGFSINAVNCASGKDRTGMSQSTSANYFEQFHESVASAKTSDITKTRYEQIQQLDAAIKKLSKDSPDDKKINMKTQMKKLQKENLEFALKTNQLEIQEKNTGSKGHKLYGDSMPQFITGNLFTEGGQTLQMQMLMYGLDKQGVESFITRTANYNAT